MCKSHTIEDYVLHHAERTKYAARLVNEKRDMGVGIICTRMNIGGHIIVNPYLEAVWCTLTQYLFLFLVFVTLPEDAAPKPSSTTPNSRLRPVFAPNLGSRY